MAKKPANRYAQSYQHKLHMAELFDQEINRKILRALVVIEALPQNPESSALRTCLWTKIDQLQTIQIWVTNKKKHARVCGSRAKHHQDDCPYKYQKSIERGEAVVEAVRKDGQDIDADGIPVNVPMVPYGFRGASQDDLNYVNKTYRTVLS